MTSPLAALRARLGLPAMPPAAPATPPPADLFAARRAAQQVAPAPVAQRANLAARLAARREPGVTLDIGLAVARAAAPPAPLDVALLGRRGAEVPEEVARVIGLPRVDYAHLPDLTGRYRAPGGTMALRPIQSQALHAISRQGGGFFFIGVGWGKTLIGLLAGTALGVRRCVYLTAAGAVSQTRRCVADWRRHWQLPPEILIRSYDELSSPRASGALDGWLGHGDACLVLDEAHKVRHREAARTKRLLRALEGRPDLPVVAMSGTLISRKLRDAAHIARATLKASSPIPHGYVLDHWSEWIDDGARVKSESWPTVLPLVAAFAPGETGDRSTRARVAFQARLRSAPGVVATDADALGVSLEIDVLRRPTPPPEVAALIASLDDGELPGGDTPEDDLSAARAARQLALGFYYRWDWPEGEPDIPWMDARREWHRQLRAELRTASREGYDSPLLVSRVVDREISEGRRGPLHDARRAWRVEQARRPLPPPTATVWVSDYAVRFIAEWARTHDGIVWYESRALIGPLRRAGLRVVEAGETVPTDGRAVALSIRSHGTGLNLQAWSNQLVTESPSSGTTWEQLIGRTHRPGQEADTVQVSVLANTDAGRGAWENACENARMIQQTTGNPQKLCYADVSED